MVILPAATCDILGAPALRGGGQSHSRVAAPSELRRQRAPRPGVRPPSARSAGDGRGLFLTSGRPRCTMTAFQTFWTHPVLRVHEKGQSAIGRADWTPRAMTKRQCATGEEPPADPRLVLGPATAYRAAAHASNGYLPLHALRIRILSCATAIGPRPLRSQLDMQPSAAGSITCGALPSIDWTGDGPEQRRTRRAGSRDGGGRETAHGLAPHARFGAAVAADARPSGSRPSSAQTPSIVGRRRAEKQQS
jgi:hypothetical protein